MYKLIAIDLDGTLLNSYGEISNENKNAIKKAIEKGVIVVIASGRMPLSTKNLSLEVNADKYIIAGNGAVIYDLQNNKIIYDRFINNKKAMQIIDICEQNSIYYSVYTEKSIITKSLNYNVLVFHKENINKPEDMQTKINIVGNIKEYFKTNKNEKIVKINICDDSKIIFGRIREKLEKIKNINVLEVEHMSRKLIRDGNQDIPIEYYYTEISSKNVDKWEAIKYLIEKLNIKPEEVITIGDNMNDKNMVESAGIGIAMGNSALVSQNIGKYTVSDNNSNGVAEAIQKFIL